ncbi:MAG: glycosyltransferase family 4 protein, partial [Geminicoccaceae bacterium]
RLVAEHRPKVLLTYNWGSIEAALANRLAPLCPHLHFEDGFGLDEASGRQLPRRVWARRLALSGKSTIVVPSKTLLDVARSRWRFRSKRLRYIPNGIDCERFAALNTDGVQPLRKRANEILIGTVSSLRPEKNLGRLLRVFATLMSEQPLRLVIACDGPERGSLEALAARLDIEDRVVFAGRQQAPEAMLGQLDIFALTSDTEQMPYCLIEAMATGLPAVVTDVGDVRSMLPPANQAMITAPSDEAALADRLSRLIEQPEQRIRLGELNRDHAQRHFDRDVMLNSYIDLFANLLPA